MRLTKADNDTSKLGRRGEKLAFKFLRRLGYRLLARNYSAPAGEIDLIMQDKDVLVFVEVKARSSEDFSSAESAVTTVKQRRIEKTARAFIRQQKLEGRPCRFDVVAVTAVEKRKAEIRHYPNAFHARY